LQLFGFLAETCKCGPFSQVIVSFCVVVAFFFIPVVYMVCSKSIKPLVSRNTHIDLEVQNPNPLQSILLGNAHTSPSASAIVGNTSGTHLLEW
jgi:hypothetical protein